MIEGNERFPRRRRILRRDDFRRVFAHGRRFSRGPLRIVACATDRGFSRLGLAVGRRVGNAVVRNRMKRRLREIFRRHEERLPASVDVVVIPQPGSADLEFQELEQRFLGLLDEIREKL